MVLQKAYISAGSNLGDRRANLELAVASLGKGGTVTKVSSFFETEPVGYRDQSWFLNRAIEMEAHIEPVDLLALCQKIEASCGRARTFLNAPRTLDLDILLYGNVVLNEEGLIIPHPRLTERKFVLEPLAQIAPEMIHPVLKKSIRFLLGICPDQSEIRLLK
jgi:2-amino-4-hydroxy-6-hydroxymethyldihydropteridine diphosphokinase